MADHSRAKFLTQAEFARRRGVSRKSVTSWKQKGFLELNDAGLVDVEATEWNLDQRPSTYRGGVTHRPVRSKDGNNAAHAETQPKPPPKSPLDVPSRPAAEVGDDEGEPFDPDNPNLPTPEAVRRKENWLGLQRKQIVERDQGKLIDREAVEGLFFEVARDLRDAWLAWPARIAVVMADEMKIDARTLTMVLTAHVQQHLAELGEPDIDLPRP